MYFFLVISFAIPIMGLHAGKVLATLTVKSHLTCCTKPDGTHNMSVDRILTARDTGCANVWADVLHVLASFPMNFWLRRCHGNT